MRIRSIRPEFWRSADISALSIPDRLLFIGLWSYVDDNGVGLDRVPVVAADLFADDLAAEPRDTLARVAGGLATLADRGLIVRYAVEGKSYLEVLTWQKHQKVDRPGKSRYPKSKGALDKNRETVATPSRDSRDWRSGEGEKGRRGEGDSDAGASAPARGAEDAGPDAALANLHETFGGLTPAEEHAARSMLDRGEPMPKISNWLRAQRREVPARIASDPWSIGGGGGHGV